MKRRPNTISQAEAAIRRQDSIDALRAIRTSRSRVARMKFVLSVLRAARKELNLPKADHDVYCGPTVKSAESSERPESIGGEAPAS